MKAVTSEGTVTGRTGIAAVSGGGHRVTGTSTIFVLVWSSGYVVGALVIRDAAPLAVTLWRFVVGAALLAGLASWRRERWPRGQELMRTIAIGVSMFAIQFGALYSALALGMPAATTALIACSSPLLVAVVAAAARWERLSGLNWFGIGLGAAGVVITLADRLGRPPSSAALLWALAVLAGLVTGTVLQSRLRSTSGPTTTAAVEVAVGALVLAVWAPLAGPVSIPLQAGMVAEFLWLALISGVGGPLLMFALIRRLGATGASSLLFLVPATTALGGWMILHSPIGASAVIGLLVAGAGLLLARRPAAPLSTGPNADAAPPTGPIRRQVGVGAGDTTPGRRSATMGAAARASTLRRSWRTPGAGPAASGRAGAR